MRPGLLPQLSSSSRIQVRRICADTSGSVLIFSRRCLASTSAVLVITGAVSGRSAPGLPPSAAARRAPPAWLRSPARWRVPPRLSRAARPSPAGRAVGRLITAAFALRLSSRQDGEDQQQHQYGRAGGHENHVAIPLDRPELRRGRVWPERPALPAWAQGAVPVSSVLSNGSVSIMSWSPRSALKPGDAGHQVVDHLQFLGAGRHQHSLEPVLVRLPLDFLVHQHRQRHLAHSRRPAGASSSPCGWSDR